MSEKTQGRPRLSSAKWARQGRERTKAEAEATAREFKRLFCLEDKIAARTHVVLVNRESTQFQAGQHTPVFKDLTRWAKSRKTNVVGKEKYTGDTHAKITESGILDHLRTFLLLRDEGLSGPAPAYYQWLVDTIRKWVAETPAGKMVHFVFFSRDRLARHRNYSRKNQLCDLDDGDYQLLSDWLTIKLGKEIERVRLVIVNEGSPSEIRKLQTQMGFKPRPGYKREIYEKWYDEAIKMRKRRVGTQKILAWIAASGDDISPRTLQRWFKKAGLSISSGRPRKSTIALSS